MNHTEAISTEPIPAVAGVGLKPQHFPEIVSELPNIGWFELHPENYMVPGGAGLKYLETIRVNYPLSFHGVGLSLGSSDGISTSHLEQLKLLVDRFEPQLVSEHLSWSSFQGVFYNDLLPLPYTEESLLVLERNVQTMQEQLQRTILIENPSVYLSLPESDYTETEFLVELVKRTGSGILLDINNVFVSACNQGFDAGQYLAEVPADLVGEIHLAGHAVEQLEFGELRIDDHGSPVCPQVWELYRGFIQNSSAKPTLIEWDTDVPPLETLLSEAEKVQAILSSPAAAVLEGRA